MGVEKTSCCGATIMVYRDSGDYKHKPGCGKDPAVIAQMEWVMANRKKALDAYVKGFREYVESGDCDEVLGAFTNIISKRKTLVSIEIASKTSDV